MAWSRLLLLLSLLVLAGCPDAVRKPSTDTLLADYAAAIRWNEIDKALDFIDPAQRAAQPLTDLERERFKQVQVTGYQVKDQELAAEVTRVLTGTTFNGTDLLSTPATLTFQVGANNVATDQIDVMVKTATSSSATNRRMRG